MRLIAFMAAALLAAPAFAQSSNPTPPATTTVMGKVKPGTGCSITTPGVLDCAGTPSPPASPSTSVQYNNAGSFGATSLLYNGSAYTTTTPFLLSDANVRFEMLGDVGTYVDSPGIRIASLSNSGYWGLVLEPDTGKSGEPNIEMDGYGGGTPYLIFGLFGGVKGAPTAISNNFQLGQTLYIGGNGTGNSDYVNAASVEVRAAEDFDGSHGGVTYKIRTTAIGEVSRSDRITVGSDGSTNIINGGLVVGTPGVPMTGGSIAAGGSGYTALDVLTATGGTGTEPTLRVDTVDGGGAITAFTVLTEGSMSAIPSNPVSVSGGTGTGATLTLSWNTPSAGDINAAGGIAVGSPFAGLSGVGYINALHGFVLNGAWTLRTVDSGSDGSATFFGGNVSGNSGALDIATGNSAGGNSGAITIATGSAGGTRGSIGLAAGAVSVSAGVFGIPQATWLNNQPCTVGQISVDADYIYACTASNTVKRSPLSAF